MIVFKFNSKKKKQLFWSKVKIIGIIAKKVFLFELKI
jgi:hypothetical protein